MCSKGGLGAVRTVATKPHRMFSGGGRLKRPDQAAADPAAVTGGAAPVQSTQTPPSVDRELERRGAIRRRRDALLQGSDSLQQRSLLTRLGAP